jgi:hypothetical protein
MSFEKLSKPELVAAAEAFGVESTGTKDKIIAALDAEGVTFDLYESLTGDGGSGAVQGGDATAEKSEDLGPEVILAFRSSSGGYNNAYGDWTYKSPFSVVPQSVADQLIAENPGLFEVATAGEAEAFYN